MTEIRKTEYSRLTYLSNEHYCFHGNLLGFSKFIEMQNGPVKENGVNGFQNEDLIAICIDRLKRFQEGKFPCRENAIALTKLEEALMWLDKRTQDRINRGVEGEDKE